MLDTQTVELSASQERFTAIREVLHRETGILLDAKSGGNQQTFRDIFLAWSYKGEHLKITMIKCQPTPMPDLNKVCL